MSDTQPKPSQITKHEGHFVGGPVVLKPGIYHLEVDENWRPIRLADEHVNHIADIECDTTSEEKGILGSK